MIGWKHSLSFAALLIAVNGCSNHLSRSNAKSQIEREMSAEKADRSRFIKLANIGRIEEHCYDQESGTSDFDPVEVDNDAKALAQTGFITVKSMGTHSWDVSLTNAGKAAMLGSPYAHKQKGVCDYWQVSFALARLDTFSITGIQEDGPHAKADVTVVWKLTPMGLALRKEAAALNLSQTEAGELLSGYALADIPPNATEYHENQTFLFEKYDDGWRVRTGS